MNGSLLAIGLCVVSFTIIAFILLLIALKSSRWQYKSLRASIILSFAAPASMILMMWYVILKNPAGVITFYFLGFLIGLGVGVLWVRSVKKMIVGDTINASQCFRYDLSFKESLAYWRETLLVVIGGAIGFFAVKYALRTNREAAFALFPGFFSGISVFGFVWLCLYERRHSVRIKLQRTDTGETKSLHGN